MTQSLRGTTIDMIWWDEIGPALGWNPNPPPKRVYPRGEKTKEAALAYFGWELMNGTPIEKLKKQPFWYYMEKGPKYATQKKYPRRV